GVDPSGRGDDHERGAGRRRRQADREVPAHRPSRPVPAEAVMSDAALFADSFRPPRNGSTMDTTCLLGTLILTLMASQPVSEAPGPGPRTLKGHRGSVMAVAFAPDGTTLASGSRDGTVKLWDVKAGTLQRTLEAHTGDVYAVAFSPDGKLLATGGGDRTMRLWDLRTARHLRTLEGHGAIVPRVPF